MIQAPEFRQAFAGHVPFADESGFIAGLFQQFQKSCAPVVPGCVVGHHTVPMGILAGKKTRPGRTAEGGRHKGIGKHEAFAGQPIQVRRLNYRVAHAA